MKQAVIIVASLLTLAVIILGVLASGLNSEVDKLRGDRAHDQQVMGELQNEVDNLGSQISSLNQPSDPLSAYNLICQNPNVVNDQTGVTETYYYPCTNTVIPASGN